MGDDGHPELRDMARPDPSLVRVLGPSGHEVGVGVLIDERHILTCAHVVNAALGRDPLSQAVPTGTVTLDFPLLPAGPGSPVTLRADVSQWLPPPRTGAAGEDIAGLTVTAAPPGAIPARLSVEPPPAGRLVDVFGYPSMPRRADGAWVEAVVRGTVGEGRLQLDGTPGTALRVQAGYSGGPVVDRETGRVVGLLWAAPNARSQERDSYAVSAERLRLAWPDVLDHRHVRSGVGTGNRSPVASELTILHLSDLRFGRIPAGGDPNTDQDAAVRYERLQDDLTGLEKEHLRPDLIVVTGDLTNRGLPTEFDAAVDFLVRLADSCGLPRRQIAVVPGNHDLNRKLCEGYFSTQEGKELAPVQPYWPKWEPYVRALSQLYRGSDTVRFAPDEPWTLFDLPELKTVVAGLNSTMADSHRDEDHYGLIGTKQLRWFADRLADYRDRGWLRLAAVHHGTSPGADPVRRLRDGDDLDRILGVTGLIDMVLHSYPAGADTLASGVPVVATGRSDPGGAAATDLPTQYQLITVRAADFVRHGREYRAQERRWRGDTGLSATGSSWWTTRPHSFVDAHALFGSAAGRSSEPDPDGDVEPLEPVPGRADPAGDSLLDRVREVTVLTNPDAIVDARTENGHSYLRVSSPRPGPAVEQWPVGVVDGPVTAADIDRFADGLHAEFAAADPQVRSQLVHTGPPAPAELVARATRAGIQLRSFVEYQGLLDLRPLAENQLQRLKSDQECPPELYVPQRYRLLDDRASAGYREGLLTQVEQWLDFGGARFVMLLGDFGRGKTFLLKQLARSLSQRASGPMPVLVELRGLEKAPSLDELLAQHLFRHGVDSVELPKLHYMVRSGRLVLLLDGFDELALRVSYDHAADYLRTLLEAVTEQAKIVLTSRTQHFRSTSQIRTALGEWVNALASSRVAEIGDFSPDQIRRFLVNRFDGDEDVATARYDALASLHNLLGLAHNPRMLSFVAGLASDRLIRVDNAADLYTELVDFWLTNETQRQGSGHVLISLTKEDRLRACAALSRRLWSSGEPAIPAQDMSDEVARTLTDLTERGYSADQAAYAVGSGSLLVRSDEGEFSFVHESVMEWLVAEDIAGRLQEGRPADLLDIRPLTEQMAQFIRDRAGRAVVRRWADDALAAGGLGRIGSRNALEIARAAGAADSAAALSHDALQLEEADLQGQDLTGWRLRGANLTDADLRGARLVRTDLSGARLHRADFRRARLIDTSLADATGLIDARWQYAVLLGVTGAEELHGRPEAAWTAIAGADPADAVIGAGSGRALCVAVSPDSALVAYGQGDAVVLADITTGRPLRVFAGHAEPVSGVAFSPDGRLLATASYDTTARLWDTTTGTTRAILRGHTGRLYGIAFAQDGSLIATASGDRTVRLWDTTGADRGVLTGHGNIVHGVAFSPNRPDRLATASYDGTARMWDCAAGTARTMLGHEDEVYGVAFSPDGSLLATASLDRTARIWETEGGIPRTTLTGHEGGVSGVAFSPDGTLVATSSRDRTARIWDTATGHLHAVLRGHASGVSRLAFSPDGGILATASRDRTTRVWDTASWSPHSTLAAHTSGVLAVALSPGAKLVACGAPDNTVRVWDRATGQLRHVLTGHGGPITGLAFSPDGTLLATASRDRTARIWELSTARVRVVLEGHSAGLTGIVLAPGGEYVATASYDRTARLWDLASGTTIWTLEGHEREVSAVAFSANAELVVTAAYDRTARVWVTETGECRAVLSGHGDAVTGVAYGAGAAAGLVATASQDGTARVWRESDNEPAAVLRGHSSGLSAVRFSADGELLATASADHTVRIWDQRTDDVLTTLVGHTDRVTGVAFDPATAWIATSSVDTTVRVWRPAADRRSWTEAAVWLALPDRGSAVLAPGGGYKIDGDCRDVLWWAVKLSRFAPGELDEYDLRLRRLEWATPVAAD